MTESKKITKEEIFNKLSKIDVSKYLDKKKITKTVALNYLSWANAWQLVKQVFPNVKKHITEFPEYLPGKDGWVPTGRQVDYRLTPFGCEVEVTVDIEGNKFSSNLYVMGGRGIAVKDPKHLDFQQINKTQQRCLVKALAYAGLGLNVYAGEDLPSESQTSYTKTAPRRTYKRPTPKPVKKQETLAEKKKAAQNFSITYDSAPEKLVNIIAWEEQGNSQAKLFLNSWRKKNTSNEAAYQFIKKNGLVKEEASA